MTYFECQGWHYVVWAQKIDTSNLYIAEISPDKPLLTSEDLIGEYGPGHNSFTVDEGGEDVFVYHSRSQECYERKCIWSKEYSLYDPCRSGRVRAVLWTKEGFPVLNGMAL